MDRSWVRRMNNPKMKLGTAAALRTLLFWAPHHLHLIAPTALPTSMCYQEAECTGAGVVIFSARKDARRPIPGADARRSHLIALKAKAKVERTRAPLPVAAAGYLPNSVEVTVPGTSLRGNVVFAINPLGISAKRRSVRRGPARSAYGRVELKLRTSIAFARAPQLQWCVGTATSAN